MNAMAAAARKPDELLRLAVPRQSRLFTVVDAARAPLGPFQAEQAELECQSLFSGDMGGRLKEVAPYLIDFPLDGPFKDWWFSQWADSIGILVETTATAFTLRKHFRTLLMVRDNTGKLCYFRFYDPRVLRAFLPACSKEELERFFGPIIAFHCESDGGTALITYRRTEDALDVTTRPLVQAK